MNKFILLFLSLSLVSCSSLKRTLIYSSLAGAVVGGAAGSALSPNPESKQMNMMTFGAIGAIATAGIAYLLYNDDPRNKEMKSMIMVPPETLGINEANINPPFEIKINPKDKLDLPLGKLPDHLKEKVPRPYLIRHQTKEQYLKKGEKTFYIPSFEVLEHAFENLAEGETHE